MQACRPALPSLERPPDERPESDHRDARERGDGPAQKEHDEKHARERDEHRAPESREGHTRVLGGKEPEGGDAQKDERDGREDEQNLSRERTETGLRKPSMDAKG